MSANPTRSCICKDPTGDPECPQHGWIALHAEIARYREALEWIADDVDEGEMRKWARQALNGEPLTGPGR